jgi:hypothetical protein
MPQALLDRLVWTDYRLAVLLTVIVPLVLLIWTYVARIEAMQRLMQIYWKVSSLLAITVFLLIAAIPSGFLAGIAARVLIPIGLWWWADLNDEVDDLPRFRPLRTALTSWRWALTFYCALGVLFNLFFARCAFLSQGALLEDQSCAIWLQPPWGFREMFLSGWRPAFVGFLGIAGLVVYLLYFLQFALVRLPRLGRSATGQ